jgi:hypothetical protein
LGTAQSFWIFWVVVIPLTCIVVVTFGIWINCDAIFRYVRNNWHRSSKPDEEQIVQSEQAQSSNPQPTLTIRQKRRSSAGQSLRRISVAEAEKWTTLQEILRDRPSEAAESIIAKQRNHQTSLASSGRTQQGPSNLPAIVEEGNCHEQNITIVRQQASKTSKVAVAPPAVVQNTGISAPVLPEARPGIDFDAQDNGEYEQLVRYIMHTLQDRRWSGKVRLQQDEDDSVYGSRSSIASKFFGRACRR